MKLDCGQLIVPVPWPIQSSPMASARKPTVKSSLRMGCYSLAVVRGVSRAARVRRSLDQGKGRNEDSQQGEVVICQGNKKAPDDAGAFELLGSAERSILRDDRATPVEAIDQLAAHGVNELFGIEIKSERRARREIANDVGATI